MSFESFVKESLAIEGIFREPTPEELTVTREFIEKPTLEIADLVHLVSVYQPNAVLRDNPSHRVWIGGREAPAGGMALMGQVGNLLWQVNQQVAKNIQVDPWKIHAEYEYLHPFTDGNGRSGRALWANAMWSYGYDFQYNFLQMFYYQTLGMYTSVRSGTVKSVV